MLLYLLCYIENFVIVRFWFKAFIADQPRGHIQMGSLAGAAHLLNCNAGALRLTQREQKSLVDWKGKSQLDSDFQYKYELRKHGLSIL